MKKKALTVDSFFRKVKKKLEKNNMILNKLDYLTPFSVNGEIDKTPINNHNFEVVADLKFSANEGIVLIFYLLGCFNKSHNNPVRYSFGIAKALCKNNETFREMAQFMANFILCSKEIIEEELF